MNWMRQGLNLLGVGLCLGAASMAAHGAAFVDQFADRTFLDGNAGTAVGSNVGATLEPGEPRHAGKRGGHSVWAAWRAPANGVLVLTTQGSTFDTLLAAYRLSGEVVAGQPFKGLEASGDEDDEDGMFTSSLQIPVKSGAEYAVAVDGYAGATGNFQLTWRFDSRSLVAPQIVSLPFDRSSGAGDAVELAMEVASAEGAAFRWLRDGVPVQNATTPILTLPGLRDEDAGHYRLEIRLSDIVVMSPPVEVQINTEGQRGVLARNKPFDALDTALIAQLGPSLAGRGSRGGVGLQAQPIGLVRGLNGTQIFNTTTATRDAGEPAHCGVIGGATYWFGYQASENGQLHFDTGGSSFPAVLAAYTYDPPLQGYDQLVALTCSVASGPGGAATVEFPAQAGRNYLVVLDGVGGARGTAHLNYRFTRATSPLGDPPVIVHSPLSRSLAVGQPLQLSATVTGTDPLSYQWSKEGQAIAGATDPVFSLAAVGLGDAGAYTLTVTNLAGTAVSSAANVGVYVPPAIVTSPVGQSVLAGSRVELRAEATGSQPLTYRWWHGGALVAGAAEPVLVISAAALEDAGDYWLEVSNPVGTVKSATAQLQVKAPPPVAVSPSALTGGAGSTVAFSVEANGYTVRAARWYHDGALIPGETNATLVLNDLPSSAAGVYSAIVLTDSGEVGAQPGRLTVVAAPAVNWGPSEVLAAVGRDAIFSVQVTGASLQRLRWSHEGVLLAEGTDPVLLLKSVSSADAGSYEVEVVTDLGTYFPRPANLRVVAAPTVTVTPKSLLLVEGSDATLRATVEGGAVQGVQWIHGGVTLPGATGLTLVLTNLTVAQTGAYSPIVQTDLGEYLGIAAELTVIPPPKITVSPASLVVVPGVSTHFTVSVQGIAVRQIQWEKDGVVLDGETNSILLLPAVRGEQAGRYVAVVGTDLGDRRSSEGQLVVAPPPQLQVAPAEVVIAAGKTATFSLSVQGATVLGVQWFGDGVAVPNGTNVDLVLPSVAPAQAGLYSARVSTSVGEFVSPTGRLRVGVLPVIRSGPPPMVLVGKGGRARLRIDADPGIGGAVAWRKDGVLVSGMDGLELVIDNSQPTQAGEYLAELRNIAGVVRTGPARLEVLTVPRVRPAAEAGMMNLWFATTPLRAYVVEASTALDGPWVEVGQGVADETGVVLRQEPTTGPVQQFFRCRPQ